MLLASGTVMTSMPAVAQVGAGVRAQLPPGAVVQSLDEGPSGDLRRSLTALSENPRSLSALINAGRAALELSDPQAALTFFSRAEEVAPTDPRVKAGLGSAMVQIGEPRAGLTLFAEALAQGAPEIEIAADRGLAHDLIGDPRRAQQDYALVLRRRDDAEVRRRMALSLAISGQRDAALRLIDPQLRRNDRAAWRTQTFVLALTGDAAAASRTASNIMPGGVGAAMAPFLSRLAQLSPAQKAMAVHLGQFPSDGRSGAMASSDVRPDPGALALAQGREPLPAAVPSRAAPEDRRVERRRPGPAASPLESAAVGGRQPATNQPLRVAESGQRQSPENSPVRIAQADTNRFNLPPSGPARPAENRPLVVPPAAGATVIPRFGTTPVPAATTTTRPAAQLPASTMPASPVITQPQADAQPALTVTQPLSTTLQPPQQQAENGSLGAAQGQVATTAAPEPAPAGPASPTTGVIRTTELPPSLAQTAPLQAAPTSFASINVDPAPGVPLTSNSAPPSASLPGAADTTITPVRSQASPNSAAAGSTAQPAPGFSLAPRPGPADTRIVSSAPAPSRPPLADIAALVRTLPRDELARTADAAPRPTRPAPATTRATPGQPAGQTGRNARTEPNAAGSRSARARTPAPPAHPSRHWVQIAGGANRTALPREFARLRTLAPQLLRRRDAFTTPLRATNRLLVGPFRSERDALEFVNQLRRVNVPAFAWTSEAGQEIERLQTSR